MFTLCAAFFVDTLLANGAVGTVACIIAIPGPLEGMLAPITGRQALADDLWAGKVAGQHAGDGALPSPNRAVGQCHNDRCRGKQAFFEELPTCAGSIARGIFRNVFVWHGALRRVFNECTFSMS